MTNLRLDASSEVGKNIVRNLRGRYPDDPSIRRATDAQLLRAYDEFSEINQEGQEGEDADFCDFLHDWPLT